MSLLRTFVTELRERRLLPVVVALLVGIVAVPIVLAKSVSPTPAPAPAPSGVPVSSNPGSPSVSLGSNSSATPPHGLGRDPFTQQFSSPATASPSAKSLASSLPASPVSGGPAAPAGGSGASGGGSGGAGPVGTTGPATPTGTTTPTTTTDPITLPKDPDKQTPAGLPPTQAYRVTLAITNPGGGLDTIGALQRLSVLPSQGHPLLIELGVLHGGRRVLFAVQPGAAVSGPGRCMPGPIDCQILSLAPAQTETLSSANGSVSHVLLAVTTLTAARYPSASAARRARRRASAIGRKLLNGSSLSALSLFQYDPAAGAVLDLRNVTVGGR